MKGQSILVDCILKCGKYRRETHNKITVKDLTVIINQFLKVELEIPTPISYNTLMNLILDNRPKNKLLSNFIIIKKHIPIDLD